MGNPLYLTIELGHLYDAATAAGIAPDPLFREVGALSNRQPSKPEFPNRNSHDYLSGFEPLDTSNWGQ